MARRGCSHCNDAFLEMEEARLARQEQIRKHREGLIKADANLKAYRKEEIADALEVKKDREGITDGKVAKETLEAFRDAEEERKEEAEAIAEERVEKLEEQSAEVDEAVQVSTVTEEEPVVEEAPKAAPKPRTTKKAEVNPDD